MTKKRLTPQQQLRANIDIIVNDIIERAQEMIQNDTPVITAFRCAIAWELEIQHNRNVSDISMRLAEIIVKQSKAEQN